VQKQILQKVEVSGVRGRFIRNPDTPPLPPVVFQELQLRDLALNVSALGQPDANVLPVTVSVFDAKPLRLAELADDVLRSNLKGSFNKQPFSIDPMTLTTPGRWAIDTLPIAFLHPMAPPGSPVVFLKNGTVDFSVSTTVLVPPPTKSAPTAAPPPPPPSPSPSSSSPPPATTTTTTTVTTPTGTTTTTTAVVTPPTPPPSSSKPSYDPNAPKVLRMDFHLNLKDLGIAVPDSYSVQQKTAAQPVVAYLNTLSRTVPLDFKLEFTAADLQNISKLRKNPDVGERMVKEMSSSLMDYGKAKMKEAVSEATDKAKAAGKAQLTASFEAGKEAATAELEKLKTKKWF